MKLVTSTGDFNWYVDSIAETVKAFKGSSFKYINLEQPDKHPVFFSDKDDGWKKLADDWGNAAAEAGVTYVVSHAPCLSTAYLNVLQDPEDEAYHVNLRPLVRSIEICHILEIPRIVVHPCLDRAFNSERFYIYNKKFYGDLLKVAEKYDITIMTENCDNNGTRFSTGKELRDFIDYVDHPLFAACWDTAHGNMDEVARGIGQYQNIITLGDKLKGLHIADNFGDSHHHSWPFAGIINFDSVMQGILDVNYDGYFTFEASYTLLHQNNIPYHRSDWQHNGKSVTKLLNPPLSLKQKAVELLYETGKYILEPYNCFEL